MTGGIHHTHYRVVPGHTRGFWTGVCMICPPTADRFRITKSGFPTTAEKAVWDHLRTEHNIEAKEATP